jgi:hypothetical protein
MDVIGLAVAGEKGAVHGPAYLGEVPAKPFQRRGIEHPTPVLCDTDQMDREPR